MNLIELNPRKSLNKAFLKVKPNRTGIESFKKNLIYLIDNINENETEEFHKKLVSTFLEKTYYDPNHFVNTKGRNDLVIHTGKDAGSMVGVIIETKKPGKKAEMLQPNNINVKALQELVLYYLRERITHKNLELKYLIATNIYEWYIFDAQVFERVFFQNKWLVSRYLEFERKTSSLSNTEQFYAEVASRAIDEFQGDFTFTRFDIRDYEKPLRNHDKTDDNKLIALYKLLSPEHLLKLPFVNDSNSLDRAFYSELLHLIGLSEAKEGSKKVIRRNDPDKRNSGSLLENTITQLDNLDKISRLTKPGQFGENYQEQLFNVGLELVITWLNRVLFMKLLEAQMISYHQGDKSHAFLNSNMIRDFDDLNRLFFSVLARKPDDRSEEAKQQFLHVPYLNSSLFEPTEIEHKTLFISNLDDNCRLPIINSTVLRDVSGKKRKGELNNLEYFLDFLDAFDFSSEGSEDIQEENKTLINASVLGLIFEKINGYKDGSIFTPGFITMYMSRETVRRAVVQKFREEKGWDCRDFTGLYNKIEDLKEANHIINSLKICDPAVGSGHFLVSVMNEILAVKNDLRILTDREGRRLKEYQAEVVNDELIITDEDGKLFRYIPGNKESQRLQEALFHEKQTIIENCLFGVDINPNSVKICQLRLWIELLKNAYYKSDTRYKELETLPNIDINIRCGNSLVSRYSLDADLRKALKGKKWNIEDYRLAIMTYRNSPDKETKRSMERMIASIKGDFESEINNSDPRVARLSRFRGELFNLTATQGLNLYEKTDKEKFEFDRKVKKYSEDMEQIETEISEIKNNKIYENAFEWRFEFPEVLNNDGDFVGFDVVIGNPPYIYRNIDIEPFKKYFEEAFFNNFGNYDLYKYFIERSLHLTKTNSFISLIINASFILQNSFERTRKFLLENSDLNILAPLGPNVFEEATVDSVVLIFQNSQTVENEIDVINPSVPKKLFETKPYKVSQKRFYSNKGYVFDYLLKDVSYKLVNRLQINFPILEKGFEFGVGINTGYVKSEITSDLKIDERYHPLVTGTGITRYGLVRTTGFIMYDKEFVKQKGRLGRTLPDEKFFKEDKILVVRTRNLSIKQRIIATIDTGENYNLNRLSNIISRPGFSLIGLLGILNSNLFNWLYSTRYFDYEIKPIYLRNSPLGDVNNKELEILVGKILESKMQGHDTSNLEKEIDQLVYELYGLTEEEIAIIENF